MKARVLDAQSIAVWNDEFPQTPQLRVLNSTGTQTMAAPMLSLAAVIELAKVCEDIQRDAGREPV